jgi:hypothetical protein
VLTKNNIKILFVALIVFIILVPAINDVSGVAAQENQNKTIVSTQIMPANPLQYDTYSVTFTETGLPSGTSWSIQFDACYKTSNLTSINFNVANSSYMYFVYVHGENSYIYRGVVNVLGKNALVNLVFRTLNFSEVGIKNGNDWEVEISNVAGFSASQISNHSEISFIMANGSYSYQVYTFTDNKSYLTTSGNVLVNGTNPAIAFAFYTLNFFASGYSFEGGITLLYKSIYGNTIFTTSKFISVYVLAGNYSYTAIDKQKSGFVYDFGQGYINTSKSILPIFFSLHNVTIRENGLPFSTLSLDQNGIITIIFKKN